MLLFLGFLVEERGLLIVVVLQASSLAALLVEDGLGHAGFSSCGSSAQENGLALAGKFYPPGKSCLKFYEEPQYCFIITFLKIDLFGGHITFKKPV